ncbi:MAG TPA: P-II family nitrogen regulator [Candidatus Nitrosotenuis sp.]|nr:P-II family nitrogen regulator [Candidatus Nitrosotenuis sp.]
MKKIEAIIRRSNLPAVTARLQNLGCIIVDKRNLEDGTVLDSQKGSKAGSTGIRSIPLSKIELVVQDKDARGVIDVISSESGVSSKPVGKIFVSEMTEVVDMKTFESEKDLETQTSSFLNMPLKPSRNRLVSLQKHTLARIERIYEENKETLMVNYRIRSFNDFVNHCVSAHLKTIEKQLRHPELIYEDKF